MTNAGKLFLVKFIHTLIWLFFNIVLIYLFYAVFSNNIDWKFWLGTGLIFLECVIILLNKWVCPLTPIARRYTDSTKANFDIFLPEWLARNNKLVYSIIFGLLVLFFILKK